MLVNRKYKIVFSDLLVNLFDVLALETREECLAHGYEIYEFM